MNIKQAQKEIEEKLMFKTWEVINNLGYYDKVYGVQMQGSYAKDTDLPESGSDMDLFIIFNTDISQIHREELGVTIGLEALAGKNPVIKDATSKYVEAFFTYENHSFEVQIVPIRHLTLQQIQTKQLNGKPITIGMERTPYQTTFMNIALEGKKQEVRKLKQFMKYNNLYDSSMKSQGFSGYSTECLIYYLNTFDGVISYFTTLYKGDKLGIGEGNNDNLFSLMDPIDPNRDLVSAFSDIKIVRTIKVCQHYKMYGMPSIKSEPILMDGVTITYDTTQQDEDILFGQIRRTQKSITTQLTKMGFNIPIKIEMINDFEIEVARTSIGIEDRKVILGFGVTDFEIPTRYKDTGVPLCYDEAIKLYREANIGCEFIEEDHRVKAIKQRKFTRLNDAITYLINEGQVQKTAVIDDIKSKCTIKREETLFENLI